MSVLHQLAMGFQGAATPTNLAWELVGAFVGTIVGVLPGIGPLGSMAILLSYTLRLHGTSRFTFGIGELGQGVDFPPVAMGLFGIGEVMLTAVEAEAAGEMIRIRMRDLLPNALEWKRSVAPYVDPYVLALFGVVGFVLRGLGYQPAPLVLALVIGPMMETALRESLMTNQGAVAPMIFRPIAGTIYLAAAVALALPPLVRAFRRRRTAALAV